MKQSLTRSLILGSLVLAAGMLSAADTVKVGVAWEGKSSPPDRVLAGLTEAMKTLAPQVELEIKKELKDIDELGVVAKQFEQDKKGMVLLRSSAVKYLGKNQSKIPAFIGACGDPVELGAMKNLAAPENGFTGVSQAIPFKTQLQTYLSILPKAKSVLLLFELGHPTAPLDQAGVKAACEQLKLEFSEKGCKTKDEIIAAAKDSEGKVSFIILGMQGLVIDNGGAVAASCKTPMFSANEKTVTEGALAGVVADNLKLGHMLAESIVDVVIKGKAVNTVPIKMDPQPQLVINAVAAKRLGVEIPFDILSAAKIIEK